ncbi:UNVERIFIED_CONTAM: Chromatin structure-remodeling complex protein BSH [Sesamum angustifolium]|uniref:Chromatin structure-remodeling complex protein BSH n=1 Tax=Sesamum angustifolium TaxID=2727405 RepID=A0AAW2QAY9_9LAMI
MGLEGYGGIRGLRWRSFSLKYSKISHVEGNGLPCIARNNHQEKLREAARRTGGMKSHSPWGTAKNPVKFRIPTADNLVPIRLDIEIDGQRFRDAFIWNPSDADSEIVVFAKRTVKDLKLPPAFVTQIAQSIQPAIAIAIREQLYEIAVQNVTSIRESRINKKGRRGFEHIQASKASGNAVDLFKLFGNKSSVVRKAFIKNKRVLVENFESDLINHTATKFLKLLFSCDYVSTPLLFSARMNNAIGERKIMISFDIHSATIENERWEIGITYSDDSPTPKTEMKMVRHGGSNRSMIALICLLLATVALLSFFLFKYWQKKKRDEQYARLLKLFEEDDELEVELGLRD